MTRRNGVRRTCHKTRKTKKASAMHLKINGLNFHLEDRGNSDGLPLVFLHSWAGSSRSWKYVVAALPSRLRPIAIDQRGWGRSGSPSSGFQLADLASDAKEIVKALKLDRYVLVGHSMGGKVAQLIASERPEKLSGLILVAPAMPGPMHRPPEVREGMVGVMNSAALIQQTIDNTLTAKRLSSEVNAQVIEDALGGSPEAKRAWPMSTSQEDIRERVGRIQVPTLVVANELDKVDPVPELRAELLPRIPHAEMKIIPATGHLSPLESPLELAEIIGQFSERLSQDK
jgi:pimeloyl-ACP methyl ester carboxylesterase